MSKNLRQRGLTLVELLVAMTLSVILLAGVLVVFSGNKATYRLQTGLGVIQEAGRFAINQIKEDLKMGGFGGCISPHVAQQTRLLVASPTTAADGFIEDLREGILVRGENQAPTTPKGGVAVKADTDSLSVFGPLRGVVAQVAGTVPPSAAIPITVEGEHDFRDPSSGRSYLMISDCQAAIVFCSTDLSTAGGDTTISHGLGAGACTNLDSGNFGDKVFNEDSYVLQLESHTYFVGETGREYSPGVPVHALYRFDGDGDAEELVEGVENLQVEYGLDSDGDGTVDTFTETPAAAEWTEVSTVRFWLLVNSIEDSSDAVATFETTAPNTTANPAADQRLQQEFSAQVSIRNAILARR